MIDNKIEDRYDGRYVTINDLQLTFNDFHNPDIIFDGTHNLKYYYAPA